MIARNIGRRILRKKPLPSRTGETGDGEQTGQHPDAQRGAQIAYQNAEHGRALPEQPSGKFCPSLGRGKQSAECEQPDGKGTREANGQDTDACSVSQSTPCKPLPSTPQVRGSTRDGGEHSEAMDRISDYILKIQKDFSSISFEREFTRPCSLSDVETALANVVQAYDDSNRLVHTSEQEIEKMGKQYQTLQFKSQEKILRLNSGNEKERARFEGKLSVYEKQQQQHNDQMGEIQRQHGDGMSKLRRQHEEVVKAKDLQIEQLNSDLTLSGERHVGEINLLKERQQEQLMAMKREASTELARTTKRLESQLLLAQTDHTTATEHHEMQAKKMTKKHEDEKRLIERRFMEQKSQMEHESLEQNRKVAEEFRSKKHALEEDFRLARANFESQLEQTKRQLDQERKGKVNEIERIRNAHDAEKRKMRENFEVEKTGLVRGLKETVESLKGALVERDHFKAMSDHELAHRFQDISIEVDEFARVQWDIGQESLWPFPGQSFRKSENQRRTKQYIIQNTLWVILYESIFCTPFRVLGNQGKSLEATWIEKFGQGKPTCNCSFSVAKMHKIPNLQERRLSVHRRLKNPRNGGTRT
jgi:hypothetical protein